MVGLESPRSHAATDSADTAARRAALAKSMARFSLAQRRTSGVSSARVGIDADRNTEGQRKGVEPERCLCSKSRTIARGRLPPPLVNDDSDRLRLVGLPNVPGRRPVGRRGCRPSSDRPSLVEMYRTAWRIGRVPKENPDSSHQSELVHCCPPNRSQEHAHSRRSTEVPQRAGQVCALMIGPPQPPGVSA